MLPKMKATSRSLSTELGTSSPLGNRLTHASSYTSPGLLRGFKRRQVAAFLLDEVLDDSASFLRAGPDDLHYSASLNHVANISYPTGRMIHFDPVREQCIGDSEANDLLTGKYRALCGA
jgi:hypothetical protein